MTKSQHVPYLVACAMSFAAGALGAGCAEEIEPSSDTRAALSDAPVDCEPEDKPDGGSDDKRDGGPDGGPDSDPVRITNVTASGAGCPVGSWSYDPVAGSNRFVLRFDDFAIEAASQTKATQQLACNLTLTIKGPKNRSFALRSVSFAGHANLEPGAKGTFLFDQAYSGWGVAPNTKTVQRDLDSAGAFTVKYEPETAGVPLFFAPCDVTSKLQLRTRLVVETPGGAGTSVAALTEFLGAEFVTGPCAGSTATPSIDAGTSP